MKFADSTLAIFRAWGVLIFYIFALLIFFDPRPLPDGSPTNNAWLFIGLIVASTSFYCMWDGQREIIKLLKAENEKIKEMLK